MEKGIPAKGSPPKTKDEKPEIKDLRSNPPTKVKLPGIKPGPPPVKDKPTRFAKSNDDHPPLSPKCPEENDVEQFDGVDVSSDKLSHPTANRAKPPQRRPPSGLHSPSDQTEVDTLPKETQTEKFNYSPKAAENLAPTAPCLTEEPPKTTPALPPATGEGGAPPCGGLQAEVRELRMALELLQARHDRDMEDMKEQLRHERNKRTELQEEVQRLMAKH